MVGDKALKPDRVTFPFCKSAARLEETIKSTQVEIAGKKVVDAIKALMPYPGGDELLCGVNSLDIADKHRLIVTVGRATSVDFNDIKRVFPELKFSAQDGAILKVTGLHIMTVGVGFSSRAVRRQMPVTEYEPNIQQTFQICFADGQTFAAQPVIAKLHAMVGRVNEVIEALADAYV